MSETTKKVVNKTTTNKSKTAKKKPIFAALREVFHQVCRRDSLNIRMSKDLEQVMRWGKLTRDEAVLFAFFAVQSASTNGIEWWQFDDLQNCLDVEAYDYAEYLPVMDKLMLKGFFQLRYDMKHVPGTFSKDTYFSVPESVANDLCYNRKFTPYKPRESETENNCLTYLYRCSKEGFNASDSYYWELVKCLYGKDETLQIFSDFENWHDHLAPVEGLKLFTRLGSSLLNNGEAVSLKDALEVVRDGDPAWIVREMKSFKEGESILLKKNFFKIEKGNFGDDIKINWGSYAREKIFRGDYQMLIQANKVKELGILKCEDIKEKKLFYNESNQKDIERLRGILDNSTYLEMRKRLEDKGMPKGLIILMYGPPGTGKTETAMQLARLTKRNLFHVNIQEVRSCWVGESEKNTKKIFEAYAQDRSENKPILLFNEADAVVSKRTSIGNNAAVDKMENTMQNIILEEFENFDGIAILTSNLIQNMDPAFDRRILFKLELKNPERETKRKIWQDKLNDYSDLDFESVLDYDLSGGQIENIRRKLTMDELLYGTKPTTDVLKDFCKKEKTIGEDNSKRIGFSTN